MSVIYLDQAGDPIVEGDYVAVNGRGKKEKVYAGKDHEGYFLGLNASNENYFNFHPATRELYPFTAFSCRSFVENNRVYIQLQDYRKV